MDYELSTQEFYSLHSCAQQIDLITDLCAVSVGHKHEISTDGLQYFMAAQKKVLQSVIQAAEDRYEARIKQKPAVEPEAQPLKGVTAILLARVIDVCSGAAIEEAAVAELHADLNLALSDDITPLRAFYAALQRQGYIVSHSIENGVSQFTIKRPTNTRKVQSIKKPRPAPRKRERLASATA